MNINPILIIDSGVGGLSTLTTIEKILPNENLIYYADHKNAPYGDKTVDDVKKFLWDIINSFKDKNIKSIVIACNTATSAGVTSLRKKLNIPVIGLEPALKVAIDDDIENKNIAVLATQLTLKEKKFNTLFNKYKNRYNIDLIAAPGLMELVEKDPFSKEIDIYIQNIFKNIDIGKLTHIVLGCTHYIFIKNRIVSYIPHIITVDGNLGVSKYLKNILTNNNIINETAKKGKIDLFSSDIKKIDQLKKYYNIAKKIIKN